MICPKCKNPLPADAKFCTVCGTSAEDMQKLWNEQNKQYSVNNCPCCGSSDVTVETFQENLGSTTISQTKSKYSSGHGLVWWLLIGWWWWMFDLMIWIVAFVPRLIIQLCKKKKYHGKSTSVAQTINEVQYRHVYTCKNCGNTWQTIDKVQDKQ